MKNKIFLQFSIFFIFFVIASIFFKTYFSTKNNNITLIKKNYEKIDNQDADKSNLIHNIKYVSQDSKGNSYIILSNHGEVDTKNPELILMKKVTATINFKDSSPINIYADNALYSNFNNNTNFYGNVLVTYVDNVIESEKMDLFFEKNFATISNNVIYKNLNTQLEADKVEIDLITKNSKIFMEDKSKKIRIISLN